MKTKNILAILHKFESKSLLLAITLILPLVTKGLSQTLPTGAHVVHGDVTINTTDTQLHFHQTTPKAIVNFDTFNIAAGHGVHFHLPNFEAATLARVTGPAASYLDGTLTSTGSLYLINPHGILIGQDGRILTQGSLALSTLDIIDQQFLNSTSSLSFIGHPLANGWIENQGRIQAYGDLYLIGTQIRNTGSINANQGTASLVAGAQELIIQDKTQPNAPRAFIRKKINATPDLASETAINNTGTIQAAAIEIQTAGGIFGTAINLGDTSHLLAQGTEEIRAAIAVTSPSGVLNINGILQAINHDGSGGSVHIDSGVTILPALPAKTHIAAKIAVSALEEYDQIPRHGGTVQILGQDINLASTASIQADGFLSTAGKILVGGDYQGKNPNLRNAQRVTINPQALLTADAQHKGDGGTIIIWSDHYTQMLGTLSARGGSNAGDGGFIEISSAGHLALPPTLDATAAAHNGKAGTILFDPSDITISNNPNSEISGPPNFTSTAATSNISYNTINSLLNQGTSVIISTSSAGNGNGDITFISDRFAQGGVLNFTGNNTTLTLNAHRNIIVQEGVTINLKGTANTGQQLILNANTTNGSINILGNLTLDAAMDGLKAQAAAIHFGPKGALFAGAGDISIHALQGDITFDSGAVLNASPSSNPSIETHLTLNANKGQIIMAKNGPENPNKISSIIIDGHSARLKAEKDITLADIQFRLNGSRDVEITSEKGSINITDLFAANLGNQNLILSAAKDITQQRGADFYILTRPNNNSTFSLLADTGKITLEGNLYADSLAPLNLLIESQGDVTLNGSYNSGKAREYSILSNEGSVQMLPSASLNTAASQIQIIAEKNLTLGNLEFSLLTQNSHITASTGTITLSGLNNFSIDDATLLLKAHGPITLSESAEIQLRSSRKNGVIEIDSQSDSQGSLDIQASLQSTADAPVAFKASAPAITLGPTAQLKSLRGIDLKSRSSDITLAANAKIDSRSMTDPFQLNAARDLILSDSSSIHASTTAPASIQAQNNIRLSTVHLESTHDSDIVIRAINGSILDNTNAETANLSWKTANNRSLHLQAGQHIGTPQNDLNLRALADNAQLRIQANQHIYTTESGSNISTLSLQTVSSASGDIRIKASGATNLVLAEPVATQAPGRSITITNDTRDGRLTQNATIGSPSLSTSIHLAASREIQQSPNTKIQASGGSVKLETTDPNAAGKIHGATGPYRSLQIDNASTLSARTASPTLTAAGAIDDSGLIKISHDTTAPTTTVENLTGRNIILTHRGPDQSQLIINQVQSTNNTDSRLMILAGRHSGENTPDNLRAADLVINGNIQSPSQNFNNILLAANRNVTINNSATVQARNGGVIQIVADESKPTSIGEGRITNQGTLNAGNNGQVILYSNRLQDTRPGVIVAANSADAAGQRFYQRDLGTNAYNPLSIPSNLPPGQTPGADLYKESAPGGGGDDGSGNNPPSGGGGNNPPSGGGGNNPPSGGGGNNPPSGGGDNNPPSGSNNPPGGGSNNPPGEGTGVRSGFGDQEDESLRRFVAENDKYLRMAIDALNRITTMEQSKIAQKGVYGRPWDYLLAEIYIGLNLANEEIPDTLRVWRDNTLRRLFVGEKKPPHINVEGLPDAVVQGVYNQEYWGRYTTQERIEIIREILEKRYKEKRAKKKRPSTSQALEPRRTVRSTTTVPAPTMPNQGRQQPVAPSRTPINMPATQGLVPPGTEEKIDPSFFRTTVIPPDGGRPIIVEQPREIRRPAIPPEDSGIYRILPR
ncbi:MAG: filamentous hemagglutinin N-terminal domain-containing protein [Verrucomicrobiae bacterium]|nr:filamentous hemagglutinin N-terminal domain-containing protein [Verrucomicrobiae bacterium]